MHTISQEAHKQARQLLEFIDASPSPWHAVSSIESRLLEQGFIRLQEQDAWSLKPGGSYFVSRKDASIIAFRMGEKPVSETGFRIVGAHTDSPGLRLKPKAAYATDGIARLAVEVYGGPILATFTDRDLSLAGRVNVRSGQGFETHLVRFEQPLVRLPNLAIHMNREVNEQGLKLHKQNELPLIFGFGKDTETAAQAFLQLLATQLKVEPDRILNWEMNVYDTQPGVFWGADQEFIADSQLDNLASCHAGITALLQAQTLEATAVCALFDHEEVGSESASGAGGSFIADVLARIAAAQGLSEEMRLAAHARSFIISADMAHAYHPNFPNAYEPGHKVMVNGGPVIKINVNQRYSSDANTSAQFMLLCEKAGVPYQQYAHRTDLGCGSTIGPIVSSALGMAGVDVGCPMWAMHSLRESAGVLDHHAMIKVLQAAFEA
ncbi:MAG: M18 family aminopeptidase [Betaproteobacteria bacterium HGW-Betaproteobacteria-1]|jgi:aspartyl aminopeptidase|nr:MAG: M18 family aminopeptidase [Betaproteobacteria bacterium HGW-Betaproteobacteria-1]